MAGIGLFDKLFKNVDKEQEKVQKANTNQIAVDANDGAVTLDDPINQFVLNMDWTAGSSKEQIETYREVASYNEVDYAVEDIVNEAVSYSDSEDPVQLDLSDTEFSDTIKNKIRDRWERLSTILDLKNTVHSRLKSFYVDGRSAYQKVVEVNNPSKGLVNVVELDAKYITKVRNVIYDDNQQVIKGTEEYFIYDEKDDSKKKKTNQQYKKALRLDKSSISYVTSGLTDPKTGDTISWLHKAVKPANQLQMMENALVVYRISRAPERRIFYIDTGGQPPSKAKQTLEMLKNQYRNRMQYDPESGSVQDKRHLMTMQEDYWLPRDSNGRGTQVDTLQGGQHLGELEDVLYFMKKMYKALNIPISRLESDSLVSFGRQSEINRDELKFNKFVSKVRNRFAGLFMDMIKTDCILSRIVTDKEWTDNESKIRFIFAQDMYLEEQKKFEVLRDRVELVEQLDRAGFIGKYISHDYVRREVFKQTDEEIKEMDEQISSEKDNEQFNNEDTRF